MAACDVDSLLADAKCLLYLPSGGMDASGVAAAIQIPLLCGIANGGGVNVPAILDQGGDAILDQGGNAVLEQ